MVLLMDEDQVGNIAGVTAMGNEGRLLSESTSYKTSVMERISTRGS